MTTRKLADGPRRHYGQSPGKMPNRRDFERRAATMAKAIEKEQKTCAESRREPCANCDEGMGPCSYTRTFDRAFAVLVGEDVPNKVLDAIESALIRKFRPKYNKTVSSGLKVHDEEIIIALTQGGNLVEMVREVLKRGHE